MIDTSAEKSQTEQKVNQCDNMGKTHRAGQTKNTPVFKI